MRIGIFQAIGLAGIVLIVVALLVLSVPLSIGDAESWVLLSIFVGMPLILIGIAGAWVTAFRKPGQSR